MPNRPCEPGLFRLVPIGPEHRLELFDEVVDVFELAVDRGKSHEGHLVDRAETVEDLFPDIPRRNLAVEVLINVRLDVANDRLDLTFAHRPLVACLFQAGPNLLAIERYAGAILLDDLERRLFDFLVRRESSLANQAFAAASDDEVLARAGVDDFRLPVATKWAHHVSETIFKSVD